MDMKNLAGRKVLTLIGDYAIIEEEGENEIRVSYKGRSHIRDKSVLGTSLFLVDETAQELEGENRPVPEALQDHSVKRTQVYPGESSAGQEKLVQPEKTCKNCLQLRKENCFGSRDRRICDDFLPAPDLSREEMDRWPKVCDATRYKWYRKR